MERINREDKKITRREFLKKAGKAIIGAGTIGAVYKLAKESAQKRIENAPEGIYYLLTGEKKQIEGINEGNYQNILNLLKEKLEKELKVNIEKKSFENIDDGIREISSLVNNSTIILVLWPTKSYPQYEPSLGIVLEAKENYLKVWDPNSDSGNVEYHKKLDIWREEKRPLVFLSINKKFTLDRQRQNEIIRSIKESRERP